MLLLASLVVVAGKQPLAFLYRRPRMGGQRYWEAKALNHYCTVVR
jgi:hypothetical protein